MFLSLIPAHLSSEYTKNNFVWRFHVPESITESVVTTVQVEKIKQVSNCKTEIRSA